MNCKLEKTDNANEVKLEITVEASKFDDAMKKVVLIIISLILVCVLGVLIFAVCFKDGKIDIENTTTTNIETTENIEVVDENVIKDVIPDGAIYKRGNTEYKSGEKIPAAEVGDVLIYKGYEYQYCKEKQKLEWAQKNQIETTEVTE